MRFKKKGTQKSLSVKILRLNSGVMEFSQRNFLHEIM